jgi:predicted TIM-barrel fold metal-dependent hydrolase
MFGVELSEYDKTVYSELNAFLPKKIIDAHTHVWKKEFEREDENAKKGLVTWTELVARDCEIEDLRKSYNDLLPKSEVTPVIFGMPTADLRKANAYAEECAKKYSYPSLYCTSWDTPCGELENALESGFAGIKPYLSNSPAHIPASEIRIFDFLPKEHLEIINRRRGAVMLHIPRPGRLKDPVNLRELVEIEEKYPDIKLIVAHIGRAYTPFDIGDAFDVLKNTKNMRFDFSANTLDEALYACLNTFGPRRLLFGSDMPITKMRMFRIYERDNYINVVPKGLYGDLSTSAHMSEAPRGSEDRITLFFYEILLAFKRTAERLGLSESDVRDVLYNNAADIFGVK